MTLSCLRPHHTPVHRQKWTESFQEAKTPDGSSVIWDLNPSKASLSVSLPSNVAAAAYWEKNKNRNTWSTAWIAKKVWKLKLAGKTSILENVKEQEMIALGNVVFGIGALVHCIQDTKKVPRHINKNLLFNYFFFQDWFWLWWLISLIFSLKYALRIFQLLNWKWKLTNYFLFIISAVIIFSLKYALRVSFFFKNEMLFLVLVHARQGEGWLTISFC